MAAVIKIVVETTGGLSQVQKDVQQLGETAKSSGGGFNALQEIATGALRAVGEAVTGLALKGFQMLGDAISDGIADARQNAQIQAQTAAVLKSTGNAAGRTAEQIADYASSLSDAAGQSLFGDDQVQESTNLLLTFTNIRDKTLDAATAISVDMAQALGGAPKDAAIQLGKALNDPIKGITALTRVGVTFDDQQRAQIQAMQEAGDMAGAQAVILAELNKEFGGSAAAAAKATGGWSEFNGRLGEAKEALGAAVLPLLNSFAGVLNDSVLPAVETFASAIGPLITDLMQSYDEGGITGVLNNLYFVLTGSTGPFNAFADAIDGFMTTLQNTNPIDVFSAATSMLANFWSTQLQPALQAVWTVLQTQVWPILQDLATALFPLVGAAIQILAGFWTDVLVPAVQMLWSLLTTVVLPVIAALAGWLRDNLPGAIQATADFLTDTLFPILRQVYDWINANVIPILAQLAQWLITNVPIAIQAASDFFNTVLLPAIQVIWAFINDNVFPLFTTLWQWLQATIPAALQTLASFWNTVLLPAINAVWGFIQNFLIPLFTALANVVIALVKLEINALTALWNNVFLPAITAVYNFIKTYLGPVFQWLDINILRPLFEILNSISISIIGTLYPQFQKLSNIIKDEVAAAFGKLESWAGAAKGGLSSIGEAIQNVIKWLNDLAAKIGSISIPDWLEGKSPPPMANWFSDIGAATRALNEQLPALQANLNAQIGPQGQSITNTASTRSFSYSPTIYSSGGTDMSMDLALANSLASV